MTTPQQAGQSAPNEGTKPPPLWLFKAINPVIKVLLRSPLHGLLSKMLMLLTYTGRKTSTVRTIPIGYFVWDDDSVIAFTTARWWVNLLDGTPVILRVKGRSIEAVPTVLHQRDEVIATLQEFIKRQGLATARKLPIGLAADREPTETDFQTLPAGRVFVRFTFTKRA